MGDWPEPWSGKWDVPEDRIGVMVGDPDYEKETLIFLPHSCDSWVIGTADDARRMIVELEAAIVEYERRVTV